MKPTMLVAPSLLSADFLNLKREVEAIIECGEELGCSNLLIVTRDDERTIVKDGHTVHPVGYFGG